MEVVFRVFSKKFKVFSQERSRRADYRPSSVPMSNTSNRGSTSHLCRRLRPSLLIRSSFITALGCLGWQLPVAADSSLPQPAGRSDARAAFSETIGAPIAPIAAPAPVKAEEGIASAEASESAPAEDTRIEIKAVHFSGNSLFSDAELAQLIRADLGRALSFSELQALAARVQEYYHAQGYLVSRVVIPRQDIGADRVLELRVLEGALGAVEVSGNRRYSDDRVEAVLQQNELSPGQPFRISDLERALVRLNQVNGISATSALRAGEVAGSTDIEVVVEEERRVTGSVEVNNFGNKSTGEIRIVPSVALPNFTGRGDLASLFGVFAPEESGLYFAQASYATPIGYRGWAASGYFSHGNYQVGREFEALEIEGDNSAAGIGLSYQMIRSARFSMTFDGWFEASDIEQTMLGTTSSEDKIRKLRLGVNLDRRDLRGRTIVSAHLHQGLGEMLGGMESNSTLSSRSFGGADNNFTKFVASVTRLQSLRPNLFLVGHLAMQYAVDSVVAGEQIFIGGANSVRGHPQSAFSGDDGFVVNVEARYSILPNSSRYQLAAFLDHGEVHIKRPVIGQDSWHRISGTGIGGRATVFEDLELRLDLGIPLGEKSGADAYVYAQARYRF